MNKKSFTFNFQEFRDNIIIYINKTKIEDKSVDENRDIFYVYCHILTPPMIPNDLQHIKKHLL